MCLCFDFTFRLFACLISLVLIIDCIWVLVLMILGIALLMVVNATYFLVFLLDWIAVV